MAMHHQQKFSPWISQSITTWKSLIEERTPAFFKAGTLVYAQGDLPKCVYIVKSGRVRITYYHDDGEELQLYIMERGSMFGENGCQTQYEMDLSAITIVDTELYCIPTSELIDRMDRDKSIRDQVLWLNYKKSSILIGQVLSLSVLQSPQRVARILLHLSDEYGEPCAKGTRITIRFTLQDISGITNSSRVTVSNTVMHLKNAEILYKSGGHYVIRNLEKLRSFASQNGIEAKHAQRED